jgi:hypothetical protein
MPKCKSCEHYRCKDWSVNYECKRGRSTPDYGDTDSCSEYEEQYNCIVAGTLGLEKGWSYREEEEYKSCDYTDSNYKIDKNNNKKYKDEDYSSSTGNYYSSSSNSDSIAGCLIGLIAIEIIGIFFLFDINSCAKRENNQQYYTSKTDNDLSEIIITDEGVKILISRKINTRRYETVSTYEILSFDRIQRCRTEYNERKEMYEVVLWFCHQSDITPRKLGYSNSKEYTDKIAKKISIARDNWKILHKENLTKYSCDKYE